jgi:hypothetical protein
MLAYPGGVTPVSNAFVHAYDEPWERPISDQAWLVEILNPCGLALRDGIDLNSQLAESPEKGNATLDAYCEEAREAIERARSNDVDGILYRLHGATAKHCSPMQYGGYYLERDRDLLQSASSLPANCLFVVGAEETYLDFVSDLPAQVICWDEPATGFSLEQMREMRPGPTCTVNPHSEILLTPETSGRPLIELLEGALTHA